MPIKFRCSHCRQFLGISRSKAGKIVDCPTCGRALRVPELDGSIEPIPQPALNLRDSRLIKALDELASIGEIDDEEEDIEFHDVQPGSKRPDVQPATKQPEEMKVVAAPTPAPSPVAVDPPKPVSAPPAPILDAETFPGPDPSEAAPQYELKSERKEQQDPLAELAAVGNASPSVATSQTKNNGLGIVQVAIAVSIVGVAAFFLGFFTGRKTSSSGTGDTQITEKNDSPKPDIKQSNSDDTNKSEVAAIQGRITFQSEEGDTRADSGARIIALPQERQGESKMAVAGFRAADGEFDVNLARDTLRRLGGDVAFADDSGEFEIQLSDPGAFHVLVVSHFRQRDDNQAEIDADLKAVLAKFFYAPSELLGRLQYHHREVHFNGSKTEPLDYSFE